MTFLSQNNYLEKLFQMSSDKILTGKITDNLIWSLTTTKVSYTCQRCKVPEHML